MSRTLRGMLLLVMGFVVSSCTLLEKPTLVQPLDYDVRGVAVIAGPRISPALIGSVDRRISDAIDATQHETPLPRVVVTVDIRTVETGFGMASDRNRAVVIAKAAAVETGETVAVGSFEVFSLASSPQMAEQSLAEEIAARVRFIFSLSTPSVSRYRRPVYEQPPAPIGMAPPPTVVGPGAFPLAPAGMPDAGPTGKVVVEPAVE